MFTSSTSSFLTRDLKGVKYHFVDVHNIMSFDIRSRRTWDWDEILRIHLTNFLGYTRRASAAQLRINIHTRSRVISIAHPVLTIPYVWRVTHEYINEGLKQGLKN